MNKKFTLDEVATTVGSTAAAVAIGATLAANSVPVLLAAAAVGGGLAVTALYVKLTRSSTDEDRDCDERKLG